jgi:calcium/calmodulin-dependent protein kinase I
MEYTIGENTTDHDGSSMIMEVELSWENDHSGNSIGSGLLGKHGSGIQRGQFKLGDDDEQGYTARTSCCTLEEHEELTMIAPAIRQSIDLKGQENASTDSSGSNSQVNDNAVVGSTNLDDQDSTDMFWHRTSNLAANTSKTQGMDDDEMMEPLPLATSESNLQVLVDFPTINDKAYTSNPVHDHGIAERIQPQLQEEDTDITDMFWYRKSSSMAPTSQSEILDLDDDEMMEPLPLTATSIDESHFDDDAQKGYHYSRNQYTHNLNDRSSEPLPYLAQIQQRHHQDHHPDIPRSCHREDEQVNSLEQPPQHYDDGFPPGQMVEDQPLQEHQEGAHFNMTWTRSPRTPTFDDAYMISNGGWPLGEGGFGVVYSCVAKQQQRGSNDPLVPPQPSKQEAVKIIPAAYYNRNEIDILQHLGQSPFIVALQNIFFGFDRVYLVMEAMKGDLLARLGEKVSYAEPEARTVVQTLLQAVQFLHSRGVAHRDIKPENILLTSDGDDTSIKVADFGMAKRFRDANGNRFEQPDMFTLCGSVWYAAPEVFGRPREQMNCQPYDERCDIWSIGIIAYLLLAGYMPFQEARDENEVVRDACRGKYEFHSEYWDSISKQAKDLIASLLKVHPVQRCTLQEALDSPWVNLNTAAVQLTNHSTIL